MSRESLFVALDMTGIPIERLAKVAFPFIIALFVALILMTYVPKLSLLLVG